MKRDLNDSDKITYKTLYELIDSKMDKVNNSIKDLTNKFEMLEAGRLSAVEKQVANIEGRAMMIPLLVSIGLGLFFTIINYVLSHLK